MEWHHDCYSAGAIMRQHQPERRPEASFGGPFACAARVLVAASVAMLGMTGARQAEATSRQATRTHESAKCGKSNKTGRRTTKRRAARRGKAKTVARPALDPVSTVAVTLDRGRSFERSLTDHGVRDQDAAQLARVVRRIGARESLRRGAVYEMEVKASGRLVSFTHHTYPGIIYRVVRRGKTLKADTTRVEPRHRVVRISGSIGGSFVNSLERMGGDPALAFMISELFSRDTDLLKKATRGDRLDLLVERIEAGPDLLGYGHVLAARYERADGRTLFAFHHITEDGSEGYFDERGRPLAGRRFQVPVERAHVTSVFGSRVHPILRRPRPHWGIDFAASTGTPIHAVAAGVVEYAQWHRQLGRVVVIRHANGVETKYAHMSYFAPGIRKGKRISRGSRIGGVGATGLATGAHLHLEARIDGRLIDPATVILPEPPALSETELSMLRHRVLDTWEELESARFQESGGSLIGDGNTLDLNLPNLAIVDPEPILLTDDGIRS